MNRLLFVLLVSVTCFVSGCSSLKKITGQTNDTVLPGQREDILPPDQQTARDPSVTKKNNVACDSGVTKCPPDLAPQ